MTDVQNAMTGEPLGAETARLKIASLDPQQREAAVRQAEILGAIGQGLAARPYAERPALLAHMAPHLAARGVAPGVIASFDPTDANLAAAMDQAANVRAMLETPSD